VGEALVLPAAKASALLCGGRARGPPGLGSRRTRRRRRLRIRRRVWQQNKDDKGKLEEVDKGKLEETGETQPDRLDKRRTAEDDELQADTERDGDLASLGEEGRVYSEDEEETEGETDDDMNEEYLEKMDRHYADGGHENIDPMDLLALRDEASALTQLTKEEAIREIILRREDEIANDVEFVRLFGLLERVCDRSGLTFNGRSMTTPSPWR